MGKGRSSFLLVLTLMLTMMATVLVGTGAAGASIFHDDDVDARIFAARLNGAQEVPPVDTDAHAFAVYEVSRDQQSIGFLLVADDITNVVAAHIHAGARGVNGPVIVPLFPGNTSRVRGDAFILFGRIDAGDLRGALAGRPLSELIAALRSGDTYTNVHTTAHPGGEIRGQNRPIGH